MQANAGRHAKAAYVDDARRMSYGELDLRIRRFAAEELGLTTSRYRFAESEEEAVAAAERYAQALAIKPDKHDAAYNWGNPHNEYLLCWRPKVWWG